jgi:hypothetical protein
MINLVANFREKDTKIRNRMAGKTMGVIRKSANHPKLTRKFDD